MSRDDQLVTPPRDEAIRRMLMETVAAEPVVRERRKRRRWAVWGSIGVLVAASAGVGAGVVAHQKAVSNATVVHCLSSAHRGLGGKYADASATITHGSGQARIDDAKQLCGEMWTQGVFQPGYDPAKAKNPAGAEPSSLTVCVMKDGSAAVVPGAAVDLCNSLGLSPLKP